MSPPILYGVVRAALRSIIAIARPFAQVRFGLIPHRSIGRLASNIEYYLRKRTRGSDPGFHILVSGTNPVNAQLLRIIRRKVRDSKSTVMIESDLLWRLLHAAQNTKPDRHDRIDPTVWVDLSQAGYLVEWETWEQAGPQLAFNQAESESGKQVLRRLGIPEDAAFVAMHARDRGYTDSPDSIRRVGDRFSTFDFRDCDIATYMDAANWLTEQGLWVVRTGHQAEALLDTSNPMIIDYAGRIRATLDNPDFADLYLQSHCKFFLGCTAGIYYYSSIFNVPMAFVNMVPLAESGRLTHDVFILKHYWHEGESRYMSFPEMLARGAGSNRLWHDTLQAFEDEGIKIEDNSAEEILEVAQEMLSRLKGDWTVPDDDTALQNAFRNVFPTNHPMRQFRGHLCTAYARRHLAQLQPTHASMAHE